jgi:hypothetical protein
MKGRGHDQPAKWGMSQEFGGVESKECEREKDHELSRGVSLMTNEKEVFGSGDGEVMRLRWRE